LHIDYLHIYILASIFLIVSTNKKTLEHNNEFTDNNSFCCNNHLGAIIEDGSKSPLPVKRHKFSSLLTEAAAEVALDIKIAQSSLSRELNIQSEDEELSKYGSEVCIYIYIFICLYKY
jgi:hypothetical protein